MLKTTNAHAPAWGCERAAFCSMESFVYTCWYLKEVSKKLSGSLFLYEPLFVGAKIVRIYDTPKHFTSYLRTNHFLSYNAPEILR